MKSKLLFCLIVLAAINIFGQNRMLVSFTDNTVTVKLTTKNVAFPQFTTGNHWIDTSLTFKKVKSKTYQARLFPFKRESGSGKIGKSIIFHISSGPVPKNMNQKLSVTVNIPKGVDLFWYGKMWTGKQAKVCFPNYDTGREFPMYLLEKDKYQIKPSALNKVDSITVVYCWQDSLTHSKLNDVMAATDKAIANIGQVAPTYWHKRVQNYGGAKYGLIHYISEPMFGLEHFNSPYVVTSFYYHNLAEQGVFHEVMHSLWGRSIGAKEYAMSDRRFHTSNSIALIEGLVTFLAMKYTPQDYFAGWLSIMAYRAKLAQNCNNLRLNPFCDSKFETAYNKGYMFWLFLQENGLNIDLFTSWLFQIKLINKPFPVKIEFNDIICWLKEFNKKIGELADKSCQGKYLNKAFDMLQANGWKPLPISQVPYWYDSYIGPYPIAGVTSKTPILPNDDYPTLAAGVYPTYLVTATGKLKINLEKDNPAVKLLKQFPDSLFMVEFSNGQLIKLKNKLKFSDGTEYFMHGTIDYNKNPAFWRRLNYYLK
ncbi:MAG: hypothetical protein WC621_02850 [Patescibacteria group bacterium]